MNGLKYIRKRCNFSLNSLAERLEVSRQIVSMWENGEKPIPKHRLKQLSEIFCIDESYLGEISQEEREKIVEMPLYVYFVGDKTFFQFAPANDSPLKYGGFFPDSDQSIDERVEVLNQYRRELLEKINSLMSPYEKQPTATSYMLFLSRGINIFGPVANIMDDMNKQEIILKMQYYEVALNVIKSVANALCENKYTIGDNDVSDSNEAEDIKQIEEIVKRMYLRRKENIRRVTENAPRIKRENAKYRVNI